MIAQTGLFGDPFKELRTYCLPTSTDNLPEGEKIQLQKHTKIYIACLVKQRDTITLHGHPVSNIIEDSYGILYYLIAEHDIRFLSRSLQADNSIIVVDEYRLGAYTVARKFIGYYTDNTKK